MNRRAFIQFAAVALIAPPIARDQPFSGLALEIQNYIIARTPEWQRLYSNRQQIFSLLHDNALKCAKQAEQLG
jgi:hypothetical protein